MELTKLDSYDYMLLPGVIRVELTGTNDPSLVDILSEIENSKGRIYVEGYYYNFLNYDVYKINEQTFMDLLVIQTA